MHRALLGCAAVAALVAISPAPSPAQGQSVSAASFSASSAFGDIRFRSPPPNGGITSGIARGHRRHIHVRDDGAIGGFGYAYSGYSDYGDYDGNRSFDPDKWNDWWHERPERAFPRWMSRNRDCARRWYSGDVLTC